MTGTMSWSSTQQGNKVTVGSVGLDDAQLAVAARTSPEAFAALYDRYVRQVYRFCYTRLGSREDAEDATSRVFLKALSGLPSYRGGLFAAWLLRIARNVVADMWRGQRPTEELGAEHDPGSPAESGPEAVTLARARGKALAAALATLPEEQRLAVELRLAGRPDDQTAASLGKSPAALKMLRLRAVKRLRALLGDAGWGTKEDPHDKR
ncbi:MAG: RNA polymerase sigma factor [Anaerolineae bacterium]